MAQRTTVVAFAVNEAIALRVTRVREERACGRVSRAHVEAMFPVGMDPADLVGHPARLEMGPTGEEPRVFAVALAGSTAFGVLTVASAAVVGELVGAVVVPAVDSGDIDTDALAVAAAVLLTLSLLKVCGIFGRRRPLRTL